MDEDDEYRHTCDYTLRKARLYIHLVRDGGIYIEPVMNLCLTCDHRVVNGAPAGRFVREIATRLNTIKWK